MMDLARAREIVIAINDRLMVTMDLPAQLDALRDVGLADMIEAKRLVQNLNAANKAAALSGDRYTLHVVPDDRLIAAVYTLENYHPQATAILAVPFRERPGMFKALAVVLAAVPAETMETT